MRARLAFLAPLALIAAPAAAQERDWVGSYRLAEGPDIAGRLVLRSDGRFGYELAAGALDERAQGRWEPREGMACLTTEPTPVAPAFEPAPVPPGQAETVRVAWPNGNGIAGINVTVGFDTGEPVTGYTQADGWTLSGDETRIPRWIELTEPIHRIALPRTEMDGKFNAVLVPNDLGVVNLQNACLERSEDGFVLRRGASAMGGEMRFVAAK